MVQQERVFSLRSVRDQQNGETVPEDGRSSRQTTWRMIDRLEEHREDKR